MAVTFYDPLEEQNKLIGQINTNLTNAAELSQRRQQFQAEQAQKRSQMLMEARAAQRKAQIDAAKMSIEQKKLGFQEKQYGLDQFKARTERAGTASLIRQRASQVALNEAKKSQAEASREMIQKYLKGEVEVPVGTTIYNAATGLRIPLNPKLTTEESAATASVEKFTPIVNRMTELIDGKAFGDGTISRYWNQWLAEGGGSPLRRQLTPDESKIEELASLRSEMYKYAFGEGGKNLTENEKEIIGAGLDFTGKSDKRIKADLKEAIKVLERKGLLALGGKKAAQKGMESSKTSAKTNDIDNLFEGL